jgi:hypothetical protein
MMMSEKCSSFPPVPLAGIMLKIGGISFPPLHYDDIGL